MWFLVKLIDKLNNPNEQKYQKYNEGKNYSNKTFKKNILKKILKSISQNNNIKNKIKIYTNYIFDKSLHKNTMQTKKHKVCFYTGKRSGIVDGFSFSRYKVKNLILENKLTNFKKYNW